MLEQLWHPGGRRHSRRCSQKDPSKFSAHSPRRVVECEPSQVQVDRKIFMRSLNSAPKGSSPGPGGCTYEHLRALLDDADTFKLLFEAVSSLAQATVPPETGAALTARLTAPSKPDGGVRGVATGCSLRRLVAGTLAKQFATEFEQECAPFQYALSTRAGTDCVGHKLRAVTDRDGSATILSVDGIGVCDHVLNVGEAGEDARGALNLAICAVVVRHTVQVQLVGAETHRDSS